MVVVGVVRCWSLLVSVSCFVPFSFFPMAIPDRLVADAAFFAHVIQRIDSNQMIDDVVRWVNINIFPTQARLMHTYVTNLPHGLKDSSLSSSLEVQRQYPLDSSEYIWEIEVTRCKWNKDYHRLELWAIFQDQEVNFQDHLRIWQDEYSQLAGITHSFHMFYDVGILGCDSTIVFTPLHIVFPLPVMYALQQISQYEFQIRYVSKLISWWHVLQLREAHFFPTLEFQDNIFVTKHLPLVPRSWSYEWQPSADSNHVAHVAQNAIMDSDEDSEASAYQSDSEFENEHSVCQATLPCLERNPERINAWRNFHINLKWKPSQFNNQ